MPRSFTSAREQAQMTAPWRLAYDIQSPAPGAPIVPRNISKDMTPSDPTNDPAGYMDQRPVGYGDMVKNIVSHYHGSSDDEKKSGRLWYKAAHDLFHNFAKDNGVSPEKAVGYGAAFSPLTDWGDNVHHAQQFHFGYDPNGNPDHNEHDWQQAHIHPAALDRFRQQSGGRMPTDSDEDLHALADAHDGLFRQAKGGTPKNDLNNPETRANWMGNIQHKGIEATLADHEGQKAATPKSKANGYAPVDAMRASGINTLGGNIQKAKNLYNSPDEVSKMFKVLGGPKISHFYDNILDDTPISEDGHYQHPVNPETGQPDWSLNKDLGGTIDSHHIRAVTMPHGGWARKGYSDKDGKGNPSSAAEYDVFNRGLLEATHHVNKSISDPNKHITPKQLQAIVWLKHKNDKDYFERQKNPQTGKGIMHESELGGVGRPQDHQFADKSYKSRGQAAPGVTAALDQNDLAAMPPLWQHMFTHRQPEEWGDILDAWVQHHAPGPGKPDNEEQGDPRMQGRDQDPHMAHVHQAHLAAIESPRAHEWPRDGGFASDARCPECNMRGGDHAPGCASTHWSNVGFENDPHYDQYRTSASVQDTLSWVDSLLT